MVKQNVCMIECSKFVKFKETTDPRNLLESRSWLAGTSGLYDAGSAFWLYHSPSSSSSWSGPYMHSSPSVTPPAARRLQNHRLISLFAKTRRHPCKQTRHFSAPSPPRNTPACCPSPPPACIASRPRQRCSSWALSWRRVGTARWGFRHSSLSQLTV